MLTDERPHIAVLICTFRRPPLLKRLLEELGKQEVDGELTYSVVVVDNDSLRSAEPVVSRFAAKSALAVKYCVEPRQNIPLARNRAVENATGEFVAFIDDDEFPTERWLLTLLRACREYKADGVIGTVRPHFEHSPPVWVREGKFYERPTYPTGYRSRAARDGPETCCYERPYSTPPRRHSVRPPVPIICETTSLMRLV